jgi:putative membrane protein
MKALLSCTSRLLALIAVAAFVMPAQAQPDAARPARADANFLEQAAQNGLAEVQASRLALEKATQAEVKAFAQKMVDDHTKSNAELSSLAAAKRVKVPTEPSLMQRAKLRLLGTADGANFDARYVEQMGIEAHEDTIELFRKAAADAQDADVKAFASKTLPTLEHHLQMARQLKPMVERAKTASR